MHHPHQMNTKQYLKNVYLTLRLEPAEKAATFCFISETRSRWSDTHRERPVAPGWPWRRLLQNRVDYSSSGLFFRTNLDDIIQLFTQCLPEQNTSSTLCLFQCHSVKKQTGVFLVVSPQNTRSWAALRMAEWASSCSIRWDRAPCRELCCLRRPKTGLMCFGWSGSVDSDLCLCNKRTARWSVFPITGQFSGEMHCKTSSDWVELTCKTECNRWIYCWGGSGNTPTLFRAVFFQHPWKGGRDIRAQNLRQTLI